MKPSGLAPGGLSGEGLLAEMDPILPKSGSMVIKRAT